jgi:hypothetical protein
MRRVNTAIAVITAIAGLILSPVLLPIALFLHSRDQKRMHVLAEIFACLSCGRILGADSLRLADEVWAVHLAELARDYEGTGIRYRVVRNFDAICPHCGTYHKFMPKDRTFVRSIIPQSGLPGFRKK